jgi:predicted CXXCH cytochrome family protein
VLDAPPLETRNFEISIVDLRTTAPIGYGAGVAVARADGPGRKEGILRRDGHLDESGNRQLFIEQEQMRRASENLICGLLAALLAVSCGEASASPLEKPIKNVTGARLKIGGFGPAKQRAEYPYLKNVYLDASGSDQIRTWEIRWRITDPAGKLLLNPYSDRPEPLQLKPSPVPGSGPYLFVFSPPLPGRFRVTLILTDPSDSRTRSEASAIVKAVNVAPEALVKVIAGPNPPAKTPSSDKRVSSGLRVVETGSPIYLMGIGFDPNAPDPERYNPGGTEPDIYGKNHDHLQRQFDFRWALSFAPKDALRASDATDILIGEGQVVHFVPSRAGRYIASLTIDDNDASGSSKSREGEVVLLALDDDREYDGTACVDCHREVVEFYSQTAHKKENIGCEICHGPAKLHLSQSEKDSDAKRSTIAVSLDAGVCGQCHSQYGEWEKSNHSDGMPYGYLEIAMPLQTECTRCHNAKHFASTMKMSEAMRVEFHEVRRLKKGTSRGRMPDFAFLPQRDEAGVTCVTCHDIHNTASDRELGSRSEDTATICQTCHREKWQNVLLTGEAGVLKSATEYPGRTYERDNPHDTDRKCLQCHGGTANKQVDERGVRSVGGHTYRMRAAGPNGVLGGFGPGRGGVDTSLNPDETDDILHLEPCLECHDEITTFNLNGVQAAVYEKWLALGEKLKAANGGVLPGTKPGDKCAKCHRGGTLPFDDDPQLVLEKAYTEYVLQLLDDSLNSLNKPD